MILRFIYILFLVMFSATVSAQTYDDLNAEIRRSEKEIARINQMLDNNKNQRQSSVSDLQLVKSKINNRKKIITNLDKQIELINGDMSVKNKDISTLNTHMSELKLEYAQMLHDSYIHYKTNNLLAFLFSSRDFNDLTRRLYYIKSYATVREVKAEQIDSLTGSLTSETRSLMDKQQSLSRTLTEKNVEIKSLAQEEAQHQRMLTQLKSEEQKLSAEMQQRRKDIERLQAQIQKLIAEDSRSVVRSSESDRQMAVLSGVFDQNRGKLPNPVSGGVIIDEYGIHSHPTQKGLQVNNKGINIACGSASAVHSVFDGEVRKIFYCQGLYNSVMIRHGNYLTIYSNLETVSIKTGDKVVTNQQIGKLAPMDGGQSVLHFEIWRETENLNPASWLRR